MAYDPQQYERLAAALGVMEGLTEKKMFGGLCFMLNGNMLCGVHKGGGMFRVGVAHEAAALALPGVAKMTFTKRKMPGFVEWDDALLDDPAATRALIDLGLDYVGRMPAK